MALILFTVCCRASSVPSLFLAAILWHWKTHQVVAIRIKKKELDVNSFLGGISPNIIPKYQNINMSTVVERIGVESVVVPPTNVIGGSTRFKRMIRAEFRII